MTGKERAIQAIEALPEDTTLGEIVEKLRNLEANASGQSPAVPEQPLPGGGVWDLLEQAAGSVEMPPDWAVEHDHHLYGTPKRSSAA
jgi:hypothetical protein